MSDAPSPTDDALSAWQTLDLRVGRVISAAPNEKARKPSYVLRIDLGELGERVSSAQLTERYSADDLVGRLVVAAVNIGERRVAGVRSQVLVLGVPDASGCTVLLQPQADVPPGGRVH